jgi:hypothetical protein
MATRAKIASREYLTSDGVAGRSVPDECTGLRFVFENDEQLEVVLTDLPAAIQAQLAYHGVSQKIGDAFAGAKGDVNLAQENAESLLEQLMAGVWSEKASGVGARPSMVADAIIAVNIAQGRTPTTEQELDIRERVKIKEQKDGALGDPEIKAEYEKIKAERAAERAAKARNTANESETTDVAASFLD